MNDIPRKSREATAPGLRTLAGILLRIFAS
jgi:hypothetical protein